MEAVKEAMKGITEMYRSIAYRYFTIACISLTQCNNCLNCVSIDIDGNVHCLKYPGGDVKAKIVCKYYEVKEC